MLQAQVFCPVDVITIVVDVIGGYDSQRPSNVIQWRHQSNDDVISDDVSSSSSWWRDTRRWHHRWRWRPKKRFVAISPRLRQNARARPDATCNYLLIYFIRYFCFVICLLVASWCASQSRNRSI